MILVHEIPDTVGLYIVIGCCRGGPGIGVSGVRCDDRLHGVCEGSGSEIIGGRETRVLPVEGDPWAESHSESCALSIGPVSEYQDPNESVKSRGRQRCVV